jgi:hypothetical protein
MARNGTTAAELLQQKSDDLSKAMDAIDSRPEESLGKLEPHVVVDPSAGELTLKDIFTLFMQMSAQQQAMQQRIDGLLDQRGQQSQQRSQAHTANEIAQMQEQRRATLAAWDNEPRLPVFLTPTDDEKKVFSVYGEFPPRIHRVNGLEFPIKVNEVVSVPESIHAQITWAQGYSSMHKRPADPINKIADPERSQFLQGAQAINTGQYGVVGAGYLVPERIAESPAAAGPLDLRYDHRGR